MDFLTQLATRAVGKMHEVEPRTVSLFEPDRPGSSDGFEIVAEERIAPSARVEPEPLSSAPPRAQRRGEERPAASETTLPIRPGPAQPELRTEVRVTFEPASESPRPPPELRGPIRQLDEPGRSKPSAQGTPEISGQDKPRRWADPEIKTTTRVERTVHSEIVTRRITSPDGPAKSGEPKRIARPPESPARTLPAAPVSIEVTIGRVEVRAIHPAPAPARQEPAPRAPTLSLEEYLKRRNGGRS